MKHIATLAELNKYMIMIMVEVIAEHFLALLLKTAWKYTR
jgi:hypothetical protein